MNTGLPDGRAVGDEFMQWRRYAQRQRQLDAGGIVQSVLTKGTLTEAEAAAYRAPFPSPDFQTGALAFPRLVPIRPDHPGAYDNRTAIERLKRLELPVLLPWGDADPILGKLEPELRAIFRNVAPPLIIHGAGHFIQEDAGKEVAGHIRNWIEASR
jgi:haloalkane dehalogenase